LIQRSNVRLIGIVTSAPFLPLVQQNDKKREILLDCTCIATDDPRLARLAK
jgi:hypothetical protein